jgi:alpha-glucosidase
MSGNTDVYFIAGPSLGDVVRHFAELTGRAEVPPLWSMGYHQCRWGYEKEADFLGLQERFEHFEIPVSAFWYDIDYMDDYRVFTWDSVDFPAPARLNNHLKEAGIRTVTIVDPGVKLEPGYLVYDSGKQQGIFCKTLSGLDYVGRVWPGDSVFPDFSRESARTWWAEWMARFVQESAIDGVWLDMNDPSTDYSAPEDMWFEEGTVPHWAYHNQYGHFMAKASREAFDTLDANGRPFLLTRSGFTGTQRYSAIWNGDNVSNWRHLRMSIPCTLNLGLSGVAFNGPDVGGFMGDTTEELLVRWYQAGFLFPFFRNHSVEKSKTQEPWTFGPRALGYIRGTIRTRYRLLPYLYQCFFNHYLAGDPVLRPLLYAFDGAEFESLNDQFLVGDDIMVAPIVFGESEGQNVLVGNVRCQLRHIVFPPGWWFDLNRGDWIAGGQVHQYAAALGEVPMFVRDGAIVPYYNGPLRNSRIELNEIELHIFARQGGAQSTYYIDDQETRNYQKGHYNTARITARIENQALRLRIEEEGGYPGATVAFYPVVYGGESVTSAVIEIGGRTSVRNLEPATREWVCKSIAVSA